MIQALIRQAALRGRAAAAILLARVAEPGASCPARWRSRSVEDRATIGARRSIRLDARACCEIDDASVDARSGSIKLDDSPDVEVGWRHLRQFCRNGNAGSPRPATAIRLSHRLARRAAQAFLRLSEIAKPARKPFRFSQQELDSCLFSAGACPSHRIYSRVHGVVAVDIIRRGQQRVPLTIAEAEDLALADEPGRAHCSRRLRPCRSRPWQPALAGPDACASVSPIIRSRAAAFSTEGMTQAQLRCPPGVSARRGAGTEQMRDTADGFSQSGGRAQSRCPDGWFARPGSRFITRSRPGQSSMSHGRFSRISPRSRARCMASAERRSTTCCARNSN